MNISANRKLNIMKMTCAQVEDTIGEWYPGHVAWHVDGDLSQEQAEQVALDQLGFRWIGDLQLFGYHAGVDGTLILAKIN